MDLTGIDKFYNDHWLEPIYTSYLDKGKVQKCILHLGNLEFINNKNYLGENYKIKATAKSIFHNSDRLNNDTTFYLYAPLRTFTMMFKNKDIDIRKLILNKCDVKVEFMVNTIRTYTLLNHEVLENDV